MDITIYTPDGFTAIAIVVFVLLVVKSVREIIY